MYCRLSIDYTRPHPNPNNIEYKVDVPTCIGYHIGIGTTQPNSHVVGPTDHPLAAAGKTDLCVPTVTVMDNNNTDTDTNTSELSFDDWSSSCHRRHETTTSTSTSMLCDRMVLILDDDDRCDCGHSTSMS